MLSMVLPFYLICPVGCGHLALLDVLCVSGLEGFTSLTVRGRLTRFLGRTADAFLSEADQLYFATFLGKDSMRLFGVSGSTFRLVVPGELFASVVNSHN